ncbi:MAG: hypothetical protein AB7U29_06620 [Desulfobulbus sp.]
MMDDKMLEVTCPKCGIKIRNTGSWFKKPGNCCPGYQPLFPTERFKNFTEEVEKMAVA